MMTEDLYEDGDTVIAHQKEANRHRLVLCTRPHQSAGKWTDKDCLAVIGAYTASYNGPVNGAVLYKKHGQ